MQIQPLAREPKLVAGADLSFEIGSDAVYAGFMRALCGLYAGIVVLSFPAPEIIEECGVQTVAWFPYVPGLLSFREASAILEVFEKLTNRPDILVLDGQDTAHPRGFSIACHRGDVAANSRHRLREIAVLRQIREFGNGARQPVASGFIDRKSWAQRSARKKEINPVFVSPGNLIDLAGALDLMLRCDGGLKIPEPTRRAWVRQSPASRRKLKRKSVFHKSIPQKMNASPHFLWREKFLISHRFHKK